MKKNKFTQEDIEHIFNYQFRSGAFDVLHKIQELRQLFRILAKNNLGISDKYNFVDAQLKLLLSESNNLIRGIDSVWKDFKSKDSK